MSEIPLTGSLVEGVVRRALLKRLCAKEQGPLSGLLKRESVFAWKGHIKLLAGLLLLVRLQRQLSSPCLLPGGTQKAPFPLATRKSDLVSYKISCGLKYDARTTF